MLEQKYLVEYEIESRIVLDDVDRLKFNHPTRDASIELRKSNIEPGHVSLVLSAYLIFNAESLDDAQGNSDEILQEFIDMLALTTNTKVKLSNKLRIADWTPGIKERECWVFNKFPCSDHQKHPIINQGHIETIEILLSGNIPAPLRRSLKWFSNGVSAKYLDEKFQCFWFAIEILSQYMKSTAKVSDRCPTCRKPLYCNTCDTTPMHRPYPKQAIAELFSNSVLGNSDKYFQICNDIRNGLMHGDDIASIENRTNIEFSNHIDFVGNVVWSAILRVLKDSIPSCNKKRSIRLMQAKTFCEYEMHVTTPVIFRSRNPDLPKIEELPKFDVKLTFEDSLNEI